jgi:hypothetical protein
MRRYQQSLGSLFLQRHPLSRTDPTSATELIWISSPSGRRSMAPRRACSALTFWGTASTPEVACGFDFATSDSGFSGVHSATSLLGASWVRECTSDSGFSGAHSATSLLGASWVRECSLDRNLSPRDLPAGEIWHPAKRRFSALGRQVLEEQDQVHRIRGGRVELVA